MSANKLSEGDVVRLTENTPATGDKRRVYERGHQFRFRRVISELPADFGEVRAEQQDEGRRHPRTVRRVSLPEPLAEVISIQSDRSRLRFPLATLERVAAGDTSSDF